VTVDGSTPLLVGLRGPEDDVLVVLVLVEPRRPYAIARDGGSQLPDLFTDADSETSPAGSNALDPAPSGESEGQNALLG
jgi:hypothetical protein